MERYDVIVIGGGIVGATAACALGEAGLEVAVVEAHDAGASDANPRRDPRVFYLPLCLCGFGTQAVDRPRRSG